LLLGVGCLAYLGDKGTIGLAGSLYHVISHAFFKGCLFLVAGSIVFCTHERNMFSLGGLWRRMPLTTAIWCIAALGLMGIPLFNGFVSKSMLHHSLVQAQYLAGGANSFHVAWMRAADILFVVVCAGTILYVLKMSYYAFFRPPSDEARRHIDRTREAPGWMLGGAGVLAVGVLAMGLAPGLMLNHLVIPVAEMFNGLAPHGVADLGGLHIYSWYYIKDILLPLALGAAVFAGVLAWNRRGTRSSEHDPFHFSLPPWLSVDRWYRQGAQSLIRACATGERLFEETRMLLIDSARRESERIRLSAGKTFMPVIGEHSNDMVLGALLVVVFLVLLLVATIAQPWPA
ncbi:MAG: proton-conducting transporter membrane subunit, partial [Dehalococcoidia bacterium]